MVLIWAYGDSDKVQYHMKRRGSVPVYLLDPSISDEIAHHHYRQIGPHSNLYLVQRWALTNTVRLSAKPTSVWCSIHRGPRLLLRHDIVGVKMQHKYTCNSDGRSECRKAEMLNHDNMCLFTDGILSANQSGSETCSENSRIQVS